MHTPRIIIYISAQKAVLMEQGSPVCEFPVSTGLSGTGFEEDSGKTPLGQFRIAEKIGGGAPLGTIYRSRIPVGTWHLGEKTEEDLILSRILWLDGLEPRNSNTKARYIYIHGTNHEEKLGKPVSHGCIRMSNKDVIALYDLVCEHDLVWILQE